MRKVVFGAARLPPMETLISSERTLPWLDVSATAPRIYDLANLLGRPIDASLAPTSFESVRAELQRLCGTWNRAGQSLVSAYFKFLEAGLARDRTEVEARLAPFGELYRAEDVLFSAPLPMPQAHIEVSSEGALGWAANFVFVDICFALPSGLAACLAADGVSPRTRAELRGKLESAGVKVRLLDSSAMANKDELFATLLGAEATAFLHEQRLPRGMSAPVARRR